MTQSHRSEFLEGLRDCLPIMFAVAFFGMLFGATAVNNGLTLWQTVGSSAAVFAGASQFVFLELFNQKVPVWSVLLAVFAVNFRHVLYSASIGWHRAQHGHRRALQPSRTPREPRRSRHNTGKAVSPRRNPWPKVG